MYALTIVAEADTDKAATFEQIIGAVRPWFEALCDVLQVPDMKVTAILAEDFGGAVTRAIEESYNNREGRQPFTVERLGGIVSAKTIPMADDWSDVHVMFDASFLNSNPPPAESIALGIFFAAHELAHGLIGRLRYETRCAPARIVDRLQTPAEAARAVMLGALDEWRADRAANIVLAKLVTVGTSEVDRRGAGGPDVVPGSYIERVGAVLDSVVYPGWPDVVRAYQECETDLMAMWHTVVSQSEEVFILLAHAQAEAEHLQVPAALDGSFIDHPGSALYLRPVWGALCAATGESPLLPERDAFQACEQAILDRAERALLEMWGRLGLTFEDAPDNLFCIWVRDSLRT